MCGMMSEPSGDSPGESLSRFDDRLRRISTALFGTGMLMVLLVANSGLVRPHLMERAALNWLVAAAGVSIVGILLFPWRRYDRNLFLVVVLDGLCLIALAIYFSGGWESPFFPFYFFVVVFCAIYFSAWMAAVTVFLTVLVSLAPQLYTPDATVLVEHMMVHAPTYLTLALVSWYMAREVGHRERLVGEYDRRLQEMQKLKDHFQREASIDHLTSLPNRSRFEAQLREEIKRACRRGRRRGEEFTVVFFDVDDFKRINDERGHQIGDEALKLVANVLRSSVRETDAIARYGGDEFIVLLPDASSSTVWDFLKRTREAVAHRSEHELGFPLRISAGAASFSSAKDDLDGLLEEADRAMYQAKRQGKGLLSRLSTDAQVGASTTKKEGGTGTTQAPISSRKTGSR